MKRNLFIIFLINICVLIALSYCTSKQQKNEEITSINLSSTQLDTLLNIYFNLKNELVNDILAKDNLRIVLLQNLIAEELKLDSKHNLFPLLDKMIKSKNLKEQRILFEQLSKFVYLTVKQNEKLDSSVVYKQFCPMAFNNRGAFWLSDNEKIENPYFGAEMLECGIVQEEL